MSIKTTIQPTTASELLQQAEYLLTERGKDYDLNQARRAEKIAKAFTAITGHYLKASEVYLLLQILKDVRQWTKPELHSDSAEDGISYSALKAEALIEES